MAIRFAAATDGLNRTAGLPANVGPSTYMGWFKFTSFTNVANPVIHAVNTGGQVGLYFTGGTSILQLFVASGASGTTALSANTWYHLAFSIANGTNNAKVYLNGEIEITATAGYGPDGFPLSQVWTGFTNSSSTADMAAAAVKYYGAVLSQAEIQREMRQYLPVRTANLNVFSPHLTAADTKDFSGNGNDWLVVGSLATVDGPPIPWAQGRRRVLAPAGGGAPPPTPLEVYFGSFLSASADAISSTYTLAHGLSGTPTFGMVWAHSNSTLVDATSLGLHGKLSRGFMTGPSNRVCACIQNRDNTSTTDTDSAIRNDAVGLALNLTGAVDNRIDLDSWDGTNAVFINDVDPLANNRFFVMLVYDPGVQAAVGTFTEPASTGVHAVVSGLSFEPTSAVIVGTSAITLNAVSNQDACLSLGVMTAAAQWVSSFGENHGLNNGDPWTYARDGEVAALFDGATVEDAGALNFRAAYSSFNADGFSLNVTARAANRIFIYLALRGVAAHVTSMTTSTGSANLPVTGAGFPPVAIPLVVSACKPADTAGTPTNLGHISHGAALSIANRMAGGWNSQDLAASSSIASISELDAVYAKVVPNALTIDALMDLVSLDADGATFVMDNTEPTVGSWVGLLFWGTEGVVVSPSVGTSSGTATVAGVSASIASAVGTSTGTASVQGVAPIVGQFIAAASGPGDTIAIPAHAVGDYLLAWSWRDNSLVAPGLPAGWTDVRTSSGAATSSTTGGFFADGTEGATVTFPNATEIVLHVYRGVHPTTPIGATGANGLTGSSNITWPALAFTYPAESWMVSMGGHTTSITMGGIDNATALINRGGVVGSAPSYGGWDTGNIVTGFASVVRGAGNTGNWRLVEVELRMAAGGVTIVPGVGTSSGLATVAGVGSATAQGVGTASGLATVEGVGQRVLGAVGTSTGAATVAGVAGLGVIESGVGTASGVATVAGVGHRVLATVGTSSGLATVAGVTDSGLIVSGVGTSSAAATVAGVGASFAGAAGTVLAGATVQGVSENLATTAAVGTVEAWATVQGVGSAIVAAVGTVVATSSAFGSTLKALPIPPTIRSRFVLSEHDHRHDPGPCPVDDYPHTTCTSPDYVPDATAPVSGIFSTKTYRRQRGPR